MSGKLKKLSKRLDSRRPFPRDLWETAEEIAARYQVIIRFEDGEYYGRGLELPWAMDDGKTPDECMENTRRAMTVSVAQMLEDGQTPPPPAIEGKRSEQVNIRLTPQEKLYVEERARSRGFRGISDYLRSLGLARTERP